tara:strand:+ start:1698 stop:4394 length:2697 start_codon:yes stop_codon:yes gene_type:complete
MASTYTTGFGIEKIAAGEQSDTWGTTTNHNLDIIDRIASYKAVALSGTTHTLTVREASPGSGTENLQDGMYRVIKFTGALGGNNTVTIAPNTSPAWFIIENATTDSGSSGPYSVILTQGSGANVTVQNGKNAIIYCDGAGSGAVVVNALEDLQVGTLEVTGAAAVDGLLTAGASVAVTGNVTATGTVEPAGDTAAGDNAAIGYTAAEGLILTGQGSTSDITFKNDADAVVFTVPTGTANISFPDSSKAIFGAGSDLTIWHDASNSYIQNTTGSLNLQGKSGENSIVAAPDGAVSLYYDNAVKLATAATGVAATGDVTATGTVEPAGDTAAGDNAAIGYTAAEGLILTGQGSTSDITFKNDADATVMSIATGTTNVGIGTTSPDSGTPLHVQESSASLGTNAVASALLVERSGTVAMTLGTSNTGTASIFFGDPENLTGGRVQYDNSDNALEFWANASERMRISSAGLVGIGTSSPSAELEIAASSAQIRLTDTDTNTYAEIGTDGSGILNFMADEGNTGASPRITFDVSTQEAVRIDSAGLVGIGTTAPAEKLDVNGNIRIQGGSPRLKFYETDNATKTWQLGLGAGSFLLADDLASTIPIVVNQGAPDNSLKILSSGNVGIGTTTPTEKLEVTGNLILDATDANIKLKSGVTGTNGAVNWTFNTDSTVYSSISLTYDTRATIGLKLDSVTYPITLDSGDGIRFQEDGSEKVRISSAGRLGIGTASPAFPLDVVGNIRSSTGVLFGTDTAAANLLDDYEEGDWTPTIGSAATVSSDAAYNAGFTAGKYTKVGRVVHCSATLRLTDKGTQSGSVTILGLPFATANNVGSRTTWSCWFHGAADVDMTGNTTGTIMLTTTNNSSFIAFRVQDPSNGTAENVEFADISDTVYVQISGSYVAA